MSQKVSQASEENYPLIDIISHSIHTRIHSHIEIIHTHSIHLHTYILMYFLHSWKRRVLNIGDRSYVDLSLKSIETDSLALGNS